MSSTLPWGKAFCKHQESYKKLDHYKKDLESKMREIAMQELVDFFLNQQVSGALPLETAISGGFPNMLLS
jgi:hypothetical protein